MLLVHLQAANSAKRVKSEGGDCNNARLPQSLKLALLLVPMAAVSLGSA